jgi:outer membrane receptor protein involved in Fe transport
MDIPKEITGAWQFTGGIDYEHRGQVDWDLNNLVTTPEKNYVNLYAGIENENWTVYLYGRNVLSERHPTAICTDVFGSGTHLRTPNRPASYGIGIKASF